MQDCYASRISESDRQKSRIGRQAGKKTAGSQEDRWAGKRTPDFWGQAD